MRKRIGKFLTGFNSLGFFVIVFIVWVGWPYFAADVFPEVQHLKKTEEKGQFGDSFGTLNTLFTGLAFAGVAVTLYWQLRDRREREEERENERRERESLRAQTNREKYEADFEARFFRLNDGLRSLVSDMVDLPRTAEGNNSFATKGRDVFARYVRDLIRPTINDSDRQSAQYWITRYNYIFAYKEDDLGPYFRMLEQILLYVDRSKMINKSDFTNILRAELSSSELILIALHCFEKDPKFRELVERYHLLKYFPDVASPPRAIFTNHFSHQAFQDPDPTQVAPAVTR